MRHVVTIAFAGCVFALPLATLAQRSPSASITEDGGSAAADDDYGCPGYVYIPSARAQAERAGKRGEQLDGLSSWGRSKCDTSRLVRGLASDARIAAVVAATSASPGSADDLAAAHRLIDELREAEQADSRLRRFHREWTRPSSTDADQVKEAAADVIQKLLTGDFAGAAEVGLEAAIAPSELGRSDFPSWYRPAQYREDLRRVQDLGRLRNDVWDLARRTLIIYQRPGPEIRPR